MSDAVRINGTLISWRSVTLKIGGEKYNGYTALEYADGVEKSYAYGAGRHHAPRAKTAGKYVPEPFVVTCWKSTAEAIRQQLAKLAGGKGISSVDVLIIVQYVEPTDAVITVEIEQASFIKNEASDEEGPEGLNEKVSFMPMRIKRNGVTLYDSTEQGA